MQPAVLDCKVAGEPRTVLLGPHHGCQCHIQPAPSNLWPVRCIKDLNVINDE